MAQTINLGRYCECDVDVIKPSYCELKVRFTKNSEIVSMFEWKMSEGIVESLLYMLSDLEDWTIHEVREFEEGLDNSVQTSPFYFIFKDNYAKIEFVAMSGLSGAVSLPFFKLSSDEVKTFNSRFASAIRELFDINGKTVKENEEAI